MGITATYSRKTPRSKKSTPRQKNASGDFLRNPNKTRPQNRPQPLKTQQENTLRTQKTASGVLYYGYRFYDPVTGRWPSRDPIGENGGVNLYGFLSNNGLDTIDYLGREDNKKRKKYKITQKQTAPFKPGPCGEFTWTTEFSVVPLDPQAPKIVGGAIIQKIHRKETIYDCKTKKAKLPSKNQTFFEAWTYLSGVEGAGQRAGDHWSNANEGICWGEVHIKAEAWFYDGQNRIQDNGFKPVNHPAGAVNQAGGNHNLADFIGPVREVFLGGGHDTEPGFGDVTTNLPASSNKTTRELHVKWNCCLKKQNTVKISLKIDGKEVGK